jgi:HD-like signal output (HDOD) protein
VSDLEREAFGADHADLGAYLLGLWGLPSTLIEAVAFHHEPTRSQAKEFSMLTAVHVANVLSYSDENGESSKSVDDAYLQSIGLANELPAWSRLRQAALPAGVPA